MDQTTENGAKRAAQTEIPASSQGGGIGAFPKGCVCLQSVRVSGLAGKERLKPSGPVVFRYPLGLCVDIPGQTEGNLSLITKTKKNLGAGPIPEEE